MAANTTRVVAPSPGHDPSTATSPSVAPRTPTSSIPRHNLRTTAISLADRLESAGKMSVSTLTEFVLSNPVHDPASSGGRGTCGETLERDAHPEMAAAVERNSRRRVYDAMKVIVAIGLASRSADKKELVWRGRAHIRALSDAPSSSCVNRPLTVASKREPLAAVPSSPASDPEDELALEKDLAVYTCPPASGQEAQEAQEASGTQTPEADHTSTDMAASVQQLRTALQEKRAIRKALSVRVSAFSSLRSRHRKNVSPYLDRQLKFPFILVRGYPDHVRQSPCKGELQMLFSRRPTFFSETDIVLSLDKS